VHANASACRGAFERFEPADGFNDSGKHRARRKPRCQSVPQQHYLHNVST
jgi:hypothetical protein